MHQYIRSLDGIRAVAIAFVFLQHFAFFIGRKINAGFIGVDLFFVLSGYLITNILLNSKGSFGKSYKNFMGRRSLRIFPLYYGVLFLLFLLNTEGVRDKFVFLATYTYNYATVYFNLPIQPVTHFWSLGVEEQFYIFWPLVVLALRKWLRILEGFIVVSIIICCGHLLFNWFPWIEPYNYIGLFPRGMSLMFGAWAALRFKEIVAHDAILKSRMWEFAMWACFLLCMVLRTNLKMVLFPPVALFLIMKAVTGNIQFKWFGKMLEKPGVVAIGKVSYGLYIFHLPLAFYATDYLFTPIWNMIPFENFGFMRNLEFHSYVIKLPLYSILTYIIAHLSYHYFEKPILRLKDKYFA